MIECCIILCKKFKTLKLLSCWHIRLNLPHIKLVLLLGREWFEDGSQRELSKPAALYVKCRPAF